jgi:hypothetical protein
MRLGFAVKVLGEGGLPSHDSRRWQSGPHLRISLDYLRAILGYLDRHDIRMYRMATALAAAGLAFDVMLEAKGKDLALMRLREQLAARGIRFRHGDDTPSGHRCRALVP